MWRKLRILILLFILATVAHRAWLETHDLEWKDSLYVAVYPVNADGSEAASSHIPRLDSDQLQEITDYLAEEAARYDLAIRFPFQLRLGAEVDHPPPQPPKNGTVLQTIIWSLHFRWWAWRNSPPVSVPPSIKLYLLYYDPEQHPVLPHSTALSKGRVGLVNLFAGERHTAQNAVVLAHELLHTVGASDKYDLASGLPHYPQGYADPDKQPVYPQDYAELMAGRVPLSASKAAIPASIAQTLIGEQTAAEIGWLQTGGK
ncbi:MAG: hypothetical protein CVU26_08165 [Betaproteobacteria bacterium HGW-Betaproteobacteria-2]|nr:MAG: hypothetical protein CVU26_08165 [Betaproteobacteria bacterium HGW-Betaproteobacteria-2]